MRSQEETLHRWRPGVLGSGLIGLVQCFCESWDWAWGWIWLQHQWQWGECWECCSDYSSESLSAFLSFLDHNDTTEFSVTSKGQWIISGSCFSSWRLLVTRPALLWVAPCRCLEQSLFRRQNGRKNCSSIKSLFHKKYSVAGVKWKWNVWCFVFKVNPNFHKIWV